MSEAASLEATIHHLTPPVPNFEKRTVDGLVGKIRGGNVILDEEMPVCSIDDRVNVLVEMTVVGISHEVDKDGHLVRVQTFKPQSMQVVPYDPSDPADDGVVRAPR